MDTSSSIEHFRFLDIQEIHFGICSICGNAGQRHTFRKIWYSEYTRQYYPAPPQPPSAFEHHSVSYPLQFDADGEPAMLDGPCSSCMPPNEPGHSNYYGQPPASIDPEDQELDAFMTSFEGENEGAVWLQYYQQDAALRQRMLQQEQDRRARYQNSVDHMEEQRRRVQQEMAALQIRNAYSQEPAEGFSRRAWVREPPEMRRAFEQRAAFEARRRGTWEDNNAETVEPLGERRDRVGWIEVPVQMLTHDERVERIFRGQPRAPFQLPSLYQLARCASMAEQATLVVEIAAENGYCVENLAWYAYWPHGNLHLSQQDYVGGAWIAQRITEEQAERRLVFLGPVESRNAGWYGYVSSSDASP